MSTYVIGDIHGCFDEFIKLLSLINYQDEDEIICVGDYIDRGIQNYEMLKWINDYPYNFLLLQGNHEAEFIVNIDILNNFADKINLNKNDVEDTKILYQAITLIPKITEAYFDNYKTIYSLIYDYSIKLSQLIKWSDIIKQMPFIYKKIINKTRYIIVHAGYDKNNIDSYIYTRKETFNKDSIIISGHTPTIFKNEFSYNNGYIYKKYNKELNSTYINIDCGCVYKCNNSRLACIRLEDMKEFYI